jgi:hypothetical protein
MAISLGVVLFVTCSIFFIASRYATVHENLKPDLCDINIKSLQLNLSVECFFSESYWEARSKFRNLARLAGAKIQSREVVDGDFTMDFAVLKGDGPGLVVHTSGVHGVEGYAGSAIQCAFLYSQAQQKSGKKKENN